MPTSAFDLIEGRAFPTCVKMMDSLVEALELMIENDYSQLPVV